MNLPVARASRAALNLLLAVVLALTALVGGAATSSAAPGNQPAAPADPVVEIEDRIPEAVPVSAIPVEVEASVVEAGATDEAATEAEPPAESASTQETTDEAIGQDAPATTEPETSPDASPASTETAETGTDADQPATATEPASQTPETEQSTTPSGPTTEPTTEPEATDPNADAPVELVEAADELPEATYAMASAITSAEVNVIGISWDDPGTEQDATVYLRTSNANGGWDAWEQYETEPVADASERVGSDPIVIMGAGVEVQVAVSYGDYSPENTTMVVIDPQQVPADELATEDANGEQVVRASTGSAANSEGITRANAKIAGPVDAEPTTEGITRFNAPMTGTNTPIIYSRSDWGADEKYMTWTPKRGEVRGVVVHHTAGSNGYTSAQVPGIIRGIYYYHAVQLGWGDIGYNIVVDTYGRLWEGRAGGLTNAIVGGHAINWNSSTFGISVLGDFTKVALPQAAMNAMAQAIAWKFKIHGVIPTGTVTVGNTTRPAIMGHIDVASTACPGTYIYSRMGELRTSVANVMSASSAATGVPLAPFATNATAASGLQGYDPNFLISDAVMYNAGTMTAAQVQSFLNEKGAACVKGSDGSACIKNATFNTPSRSATQFCPNAYVGKNGESAAQVITKSAQACNINPQVLITILQKEQGLITTTDPTQRKYDRATGFACPDYADCNTAYAGFVHQVYSAASRLQQYRMQPASFTYRVGGTYNVLYNPNSSCGSAQVTMKSAATAGLYNYTPYVANKAALDAVAGTGDSCSAYGNRNFYRNFNLWFGRPNADAPTVSQVIAPPINRNLLGDGQVSAVEGTGVNSTVSAMVPATQLWQPRTQIGSSWPNMIAPGDWNGDGRADAMLTDAAGRLWLYPMGSNGRFAARVQIGHGWQNMDKIMAGVDWDGDGKQDLLARHKPTGALYLYRGNGKGGFASARLIGSGWGNMTQLTVVRNAYDRKPVVRAVHSNGRLYTYPVSSAGGFTNPVVHGGGWGAMVHIAGAGDWNKDGVGDLLAVRNDGLLFRYDGLADGNVRAGQQIGSGWRNWRAMAVSQQAKDGSPLWGVDSVGNFYEYKHTVGRPSKALGLPSGAQPFAGGDWDGDGRADVIYRLGNGDLMLAAGRGSGNFDAPRRIGNGWGSFDQVIAVGSWNGDGKPALATYHRASGEARIYFGDGRGGFTGSELIGKWPGAKTIFAVGAASDGAYPTLGLHWQDGSASFVNRATNGTVGGTSLLTQGWGNVTTVLGGTDSDRITNREFVLVRSDGSIARAISTSGMINSERQIAPPGTVTGRVG